MPRYVIRNSTGVLKTVFVDGQEPINKVALAPATDYADSDLDETSPGVVSVNAARRAARLASEAAAKDDEKVKKDARRAILSDTSKIKDADTRAFLEALKSELGL